MRDKIIKISNNEEFYIIEELNHLDRKYCLCIKYNDNQNSIEELPFIILEVKLKDDKLIASDLKDESLHEKITSLFLEKLESKEKIY